VWNTPEHPVPVEYYVELRVLDGSGSREVSASYVEASATLVELPGEPQRYAWRVYVCPKVYRTKMFDVKHFGTIGAKNSRPRAHARLAQNRWIFAQASSSTDVAVA
jgi:hypothetical protein